MSAQLSFQRPRKMIYSDFIKNFLVNIFCFLLTCAKTDAFVSAFGVNIISCYKLR